RVSHPAGRGAAAAAPAAPLRRTSATATRKRDATPPLPQTALLAFAAAAAAFATARIIIGSRAKPPGAAGARAADDPRISRVAVRERRATHRPRGGADAGRHLRALPPSAREPGADGERDGRARDAGDGRG